MNKEKDVKEVSKKIIEKVDMEYYLEGYPVNSKWYWQLLWKLEHFRLISFSIIIIGLIFLVLFF